MIANDLILDQPSSCSKKMRTPNRYRDRDCFLVKFLLSAPLSSKILWCGLLLLTSLFIVFIKANMNTFYHAPISFRVITISR